MTTRELDRAQRAALRRHVALAEAEERTVVARRERDEAFSALHKAGCSYRAMATLLDLSPAYVQLLVQRGEGRPSPSRIKK